MVEITWVTEGEDPNHAIGHREGGHRATEGDGVGPAEAVVVRLGNGRFAVSLAAVAEVGRIPAVTRVPGLPSWLSGVANWRGRILAVLDLRAELGAPTGPVGARSRLLVLLADGTSAGFVVDEVEGTAPLGPHIDELPAAWSGPGASLLSGQLPRDDGPIAVIDARAVLRLRDSVPRRGRRPDPQVRRTA